MLRFPAARYTCRFEVETPLHLPPYPGSAFRGAFGHAFKRVVCALRRQACETCLLRPHCIYVKVFETPVTSGRENRGITTHAPHPFVLEPPLDSRTAYQPGETLEAGLVLVGKALEFLPYFVCAMESMGRRGLGRGRGRMRLKEIRCNGTRVYDDESRKLTKAPQEVLLRSGAGGSATLEFLTPLRLKVRNRYTDSPGFQDLVENLVARVEALARFHTDEGAVPGGAEALSTARSVRIRRSELRWFDWERYSTRQRCRMKLGGVVGRMSVEGPLDALWPWLRLGELVHVGKGTSFGLGRYAIREGDA